MTNVEITTTVPIGYDRNKESFENGWSHRNVEDPYPGIKDRMEICGTGTLFCNLFLVFLTWLFGFGFTAGTHILHFINAAAVAAGAMLIVKWMEGAVKVIIHNYLYERRKNR